MAGARLGHLLRIYLHGRWEPDGLSLFAYPRLLAVGMMCAWSLSMISSPFTASMLVLSQLIRRSPYQIAWRWNGVFFVLVVL